jgi:hypothetical protein
MIPRNAYFIWFGSEVPWTHVLALRSAASAGGFDDIVLYHTDDLSRSRHWSELRRVPRLTLERFEPLPLLRSLGPQAGELALLYQKLEKPAAQANMIRIAILYRNGGVYLDMDTITLRSLRDLCNRASVFCGEERLVFPATLSPIRNPAAYAAAIGRTVLRDGLRRLPEGWRWFRRIEHRYPTAVNNAVLGCQARHPFLERMLNAMLALNPRRQTRRYALGTALLQRVVAAYPDSDLLKLPPPVFYPLGPEISEHWFRLRSRADPSEVVSPDTRVVHWYASVRTGRIVKQIDPNWIRRHAAHQWFSALALPHVGTDVPFSSRAQSNSREK